MNEISRYTSVEDYMKPVYTVEDIRSFRVWVKGLLDIYEKSVTLKTIGGVIGIDGALSAIGKKLESNEKERLSVLVNELEQKIESMDKNKLDYNFINSDEFIEIIFKVYNYTKREYRHDKIKYFANILINYSTIEFSNDFYKEGIIEKISKYSIEHILVLEKIYQGYYQKLKKEAKEKTFNYRDIHIESISDEIRDICIYTLNSDGFIKEITGAYGGGSYSITTFGIRCIELITNKYR